MKTKVFSFFVVFLLFISMSGNLFAQFSDNSKVALKSGDFIKAIKDSDTIFIGKYLRGGRKLAKVTLIESLAGSASGDVVLNGMDSLKIASKYRLEPLKPSSVYVFFAVTKGSKLYLNPDSIVLPVVSNKVNFSFNTPYLMNFWSLFDINLLKIAIAGIKEKNAGSVSSETTSKIAELFKSYVAKKDTNSIKNLLAVAEILGVSLNEEQYTKLTNLQDTVGCLAVKFSSKIMGEIYFNEKILPQMEKFTQDRLVASAFAAMDADSKKSVAVIGKILQKVDNYTPPTSECFPAATPENNKQSLVRAVIEIDSPESDKIISKELNTTDVDWLTDILNVMATYDGNDLIELALKSAAHSNSSRRLMAFVSYFDKIKSPEVAKGLISMFEKSDSDNWKKFIISTLGRYQIKSTLDFLIKRMNEEPKEEIRIAAAMAVGELNEKKGAKAIFQFILRENSILAKTIGVDAMAKIADKSVQGYLKQIVKDAKDAKVREEAANAIEDNLFILRYGRKKQ